jgi:hypothetical protein
MNTETIEQVTPVSAPIAQVLNPLQPVFDALVKAVADRIMAQVLESIELESKISQVMDLLIDDKLDIDGEIDNWMANNFDIDDYSMEIQQMVEIDEAEIKDIIRGMSFTVDVD